METATGLMNPFPGLRAFEEEEDILFFGREKQIDELLRKLRTSRFLAIIGSSGSGKSSLVKSGLLPSLHSGLMSGVGSQWRIALFRPGNDPIGQLSEALSKNGILRDDQDPEDLETNIAINETILRRSNLGLIETYKQSGLDKRNNLLVLVDQFEELFRFSKYEKDAKEGKRDSIAFINMLLKASEQKEYPIYVVFTMRSDFLGDCTEFRGLPEAINEGQYLVPRMTREERRDAITGPVAVGGATITPALLNRLLNDVGDNPDQLPILQHALMRTWDVWRKKKEPDAAIDIEDYENIGTITEALSQHAEEAYAELTSDKERQICEKIFKELTDKGGLTHGIRRPRLLSELSAAAGVSIEEVVRVIDVFRKPGRGFLVPAQPAPLNPDSIIDISHESLMRVWKRLIVWLSEEEESAQVYLHLCEAVNLYETGKGGLWRDPELQIAIKWKTEQNTNAAWASRYNPYYDKVIFFLEHSKQQRDLEIKHKEELQKQRLRMTRRVSMVVSVIALIAFLAAILAFQKEGEANKAKVLAENKKKEALVQKAIADQNKEIALTQKGIALAAKDSAEKSEEFALAQQKLAEEQKALALEQKNIAVQQTVEATKQKNRADSEAYIANLNEIMAENSAKLAKRNEEKAQREKDTSSRLKDLAESKNMAYHAIILLNEAKYDQSLQMALKAYQLNKNSGGPAQNNDIYNSLHQNWIRSINNKNAVAYHSSPVRSIVGIPHSPFLYSGDENGVLFSWQYDHGILKPKNSYNLKREIRSLSVSPDGKYLLAVFLQEAALYKINDDKSIKEISRVNFDGKGKKGIFIDNSYFIVLSNSGATRFEVSDVPQEPTDFVKVPNCSAIVINKFGNIYIASGKNILVYNSWATINSNPVKIHLLEYAVTCMAIDESGTYLAAGTYEGWLWLKTLHSGTDPVFSALHRSAINDLRFSKDGDGNLQLATASSDQSIKLITVHAAISNKNDNVVTLQGHSRWVYSLFYSPDGKYLFSGSEDRRIIGWNSTMSGIYNSLNKDKI
jgi:WD40 repeat protein/energy-coupling factor transporter ATP-binding protein EcfA2